MIVTNFNKKYKIKSNDFRNYTLGDIELICEETLCTNCPAKIICDRLTNMTISWEYTIKRIEEDMKKDE